MTFTKLARGAAVALLSIGLVQAVAPAVQAADKGRTVTVTHAAVAPTLVQGEGLGAVRTFMIPTTVKGKSGPAYYLTGTLTTVAVGMPNDQEVRASNLTFVFGNEANQIVVGGISLYPSSSATLSAGQKTIRPVIGGSGTYDGARGYVVSTNRGADGWTHVFHLLG
ncbi:MAG: hypothetical protein ACKOE2_15900 [Actinomycetales bacterium]